MLSAILLAAGESSRMGRLKALLPWGETTLLEAQLAQIAQSRLRELIVVVGYARERLYPLLAEGKERWKSEIDLKIVCNEQYALGKTSSIKAGVAALSKDSRGVAIAGVDQPVVARALDRLVDGLDVHGIHIPVYRRKRGHPPVFGCGFYEELNGVTEESEGLRHVLRTHADRIRRIDVPHPQVVLNLNREEDYVRALERHLHRYDLRE